MKSLLVIFALAVFSFINMTNGECTQEKGTECKTKYTNSVKSTSTQAEKCTAAFAYGKCLFDTMCFKDDAQETAFSDTVGANLECSSCKVVEGLTCFSKFCSNKTELKPCLDSKSCYVDVFKTGYDNFEDTCNGCGTVTVSVLMMFLSTLLIFNKNY